MKNSISFFLLTLALSAGIAHGATVMVSPGQSIQAAINAGPPDPQYNDRDGTRNDIGMYGGHNFIPDGRTTNKPIVIGLDVAPIAVPAGGTVTIESTGATVK
jgi:hypothetical protein